MPFKNGFWTPGPEGADAPTLDNALLARLKPKPPPVPEGFTQTAPDTLTQASPMNQHRMQPGDEGFDWGQYDDWKSHQDVDPVDRAHNFISRMNIERPDLDTDAQNAQAEADASNYAHGQGYHPGANAGSPLAEYGKAVPGEIAKTLTGTPVKTLLSILGMAGPVAGAMGSGLEFGAQALNSAYDNPGAAQSGEEAALNSVAPVAAGLTSGLLGKASSMAGGPGKLALKTALSGGLGYEGYKYGGVPGAAMGAVSPWLKIPVGGKAGIIKSLLGLGGEEAAAAEGMGAAEFPSYEGAPNPWKPRVSTEVPYGSSQVPSKSVDEMVQELGGRHADRTAGFSDAMVNKMNPSAAKPKADPFAEWFAKEGPQPDQKWREVGGDMYTDAAGSTKIRPTPNLRYHGGGEHGSPNSMAQAEAEAEASNPMKLRADILAGLRTSPTFQALPNDTEMLKHTAYRNATKKWAR